MILRFASAFGLAVVLVMAFLVLDPGDALAHGGAHATDTKLAQSHKDADLGAGLAKEKHCHEERSGSTCHAHSAIEPPVSTQVGLVSRHSDGTESPDSLIGRTYPPPIPPPNPLDPC